MTKKRFPILIAVLAAELLFLVIRLAGLSGHQELTFAQEDFLVSSDAAAGAESEGVTVTPGFYLDPSYGASVITPDFEVKRGVYMITVSCESNVPYYEKQCQSRMVSVDDTDPKAPARIVESDLVPITEGVTAITYRADVREGGRFRIVSTLDDDAVGCYVMLYGATVTRMVGKTLGKELISLLFLFALADLVLILALFRGEAFSKWRRENGTTALLLAGIVAFACFPLTQPGIYFGDDILYHMRRLAFLADGLSAGALPVKIQAWQNGYGYAVGVGYGDLLLYPAALLYLCGFSLPFSFDFYIVFITVLTAWFSYRAFSCMSGGSNLAGLTGAALYTLMGFRLESIYAGATLGEYSAYTFLPLVALGLWEIYREEGDRRRGENIMAAAVGLIMGTHTLTTLTTAIVVLLFCVLLFTRTIQREILLSLLRTLGKIVLLSLWFMVPLLHYMLAMDLNTSNKDGFIMWQNAITPEQLFVIRPDVSGATAGRFALGLAAVVILAVSAAFLVSGRFARSRVTGAAGRIFALLVILLFAVTPWFPWHGLYLHLPALYDLAHIMQFPWHFLDQASVLLVLLAVWSVYLLEREAAEENGLAGKASLAVGLSVLMVTLVFAQSGSYLSVVVRDGKSMHQMDERDLGQFRHAEFSIRGTDETLPDRVQTVESVEGVTVETLEHRSCRVTAQVTNNSGSPAEVRFPLWAYTGYTAKSDNGKLSVYESEDHRAAVIVPAGYNGRVTVRFREPWFWRLAELISMAGWIAMALVARGRRFDFRIKRTAE